jgi:hypothetical protein
MSGDVPVLTEAEFMEWLEKLLELYPQVEAVGLVGSRAFGYARPGSDWDVVILLEEDCYQEEVIGKGGDGKDITISVQVDKIEQRISFDEALASASIEKFFLRPSGSIARWEYGPDEPPPCVEPSEGASYLTRCLLNGYPPGDWDRLRRSLSRALILYDRNSSPR